MTIERRNPLPVGKYWQDVTYDRLAGFDQWLRRAENRVRIDATEEREGSDGSPSLTWYAFSVLEPVTWEGPGYPTIIPSGSSVTSSRDVMQVPVVQSAADSLQQAAESGVKWGLAALIALLGAKLIG